MLPLEMERWRSQLFCTVIGESFDERRGKGPGAHDPERAEGAGTCDELYSSRRDINDAPLEEIHLSWIALDDLEALPGLVIFGNNQRHREPHTLAL